MSQLQTLDRGIQALKFIARSRRGITVVEVAAHLQVHRAIAHRIIATLEANALITRNSSGDIFIGSAVMELASHFQPQFIALCQPIINQVALCSAATSFISIASGDECVVILVAEPENTVFRVGYKVGSRHPISQGAAGIALLSARDVSAADTSLVQQARLDGYSVTRGALQSGAVGLAFPIAIADHRKPSLEACIGVVAMDDLDIEKSLAIVKIAAQRIAELLD